MKRLAATFAILILAALPLLAQANRAREIVRAEYGSGGTWVDVTAQVRSLITGGTLHFLVTNDALGVDPTPGSPKTLRLRLVDQDGRERVMKIREKDYVNVTLAEAPAEGGQLRILRARYGANERSFDVTGVLNSAVQGNQLSLRVTNDTMGGDPAIDQHKSLHVWYTYGGEHGEATINEGDTLNLPGRDAPEMSGLQILRADYGADNRYRDVTARLNAGIQGNHLSLRVTNDTMGGDPAEDRRKELAVWYIYHGRMAHIVVGEGGNLALPGDNDFFEGNLRIVRAQYGSGSRYLDVTDRLNAQVQGDQLSLRVTNETMGGDPAADKHKQLIVVYLHSGRQCNVVLNERDQLSLPANDCSGSGDSGGLQILEAEYGAGDQRADVTERVSSQLSGGRLQIEVSDATLGGDPAEGRPKRLWVVYQWNGVRYHATAPEGGTLVIP